MAEHSVKTQRPGSQRTRETQAHTSPETAGNAGVSADYSPYSPESVVQLQQTLGNRQVQRLLHTRKPVIQRDPSDGLIDLAPGVKGEVGVEGKIKTGAVIDKLDGTNYALPAEAQGFIHDIDSPTEYFVQIPSDIIDLLTDDTKRGTAKDTEPSAKAVKTTANAVRGKVPKNKVGTISASLKHRKVKGDIFPHPPTAEDVNQRGLANCYFLAALMSTASQHPSYIQEMITDNDDTVSVRFYRLKPQALPTDPKTFSVNYVTVRKSVAVTSGIGSKGIYSATKVPWPALIMKAYAAWDGHAKGALPGFQGTYEATAWGDSTLAMEHITGEPAEKKAIQKQTLPGRFKNLAPNEDLNLLLPGSPKYPVVEPWSDDVIRDKTLMIFKKDWDNEVGADDKEKSDAYITRILATAGIGLGDVTVKLTGGMARVTLTPATLMKAAYGGIVGAPDRTKWANFMKTGQYEGKSVPQAISNFQTIGTSATGRMDLPFFTKLMQAAQISGGGQTAWINYMRPYLSGNATELNYIQPDIDVYDKIAETLTNGGLVSASTPDFGKKGGGISGGEDTESVPGLAGSHVYEIVAVPPVDKDGRRWLRIRNPWGNTGLGYDENFKHKVIKSGTFDIELSEFMRYFKDISYTATSDSLKRAFRIAEINTQNKPGKKKKK